MLMSARSLPRGRQPPERYLFEELIYVVKGRGATTVWQEGGRKQTFEWHEGSMFSAPLNSWRQHFNAQGDEPARFVALTDAPVMINRFRNLNFVLQQQVSHLPIALTAKRVISAAKAGKSPPIAPGIPTSSPISLISG